MHVQLLKANIEICCSAVKAEVIILCHLSKHLICQTNGFLTENGIAQYKY